MENLETTGLDSVKNGIHYISGFFEINGVEVEQFNIKLQPTQNAILLMKKR